MAVIFHLHTMHVPQPFEPPTRSFASHPLCAMSSHQPPSEGSDTSFWASVYTHERPDVLCGVITDINLHRFTLSTLHSNKPCRMHYTPTFNFIPAVSTRLKSTYAGHSQPLMPWDDTLPVSISKSWSLPSTTTPPPRSYSQRQMNSSLGTPSICRQLLVTTSAACHPLPASCNILQFRPLPLISTTNPFRQTPSSRLCVSMRHSRPLHTQNLGRPPPKPTSPLLTPQPKLSSTLLFVSRLLPLPTHLPHLPLPPQQRSPRP